MIFIDILGPFWVGGSDPPSIGQFLQIINNLPTSKHTLCVKTNQSRAYTAAHVLYGAVTLQATICLPLPSYDGFHRLNVCVLTKLICQNSNPNGIVSGGT